MVRGCKFLLCFHFTAAKEREREKEIQVRRDYLFKYVFALSRESTRAHALNAEKSRARKPPRLLEKNARERRRQTHKQTNEQKRMNNARIIITITKKSYQFAQRKRVSQVQQAIHVRIRKVAEKFNRFRFVRVHLKHLGILPRFLRDGLVGRELVSSRRRSLLLLLLIVSSRRRHRVIFDGLISLFYLRAAALWLPIR